MADAELPPVPEFEVPRGGVFVILGQDGVARVERGLIRSEDMPYDCGTKSFGVNTVYDSGDFPALFDELLRRLDYDKTRQEQRALNARAGASRRGVGLAVYVEKTGLGPFETTQVEVRPDGRLVVDTGASSMGPGLETVLAQILGQALGLPPARFDVRHADTAAVESGVGTYGSRGTVTAGNAAQLAADKLIAEARTRAAARFGVAEGDVAYAHGTLQANGRRFDPTKHEPRLFNRTAGQPARDHRKRSVSSAARLLLRCWFIE